MKCASSRPSVTLAEASRRFERWRRSSKRGNRIPVELWSLAVELAGEHGVAKTAATLRLEYYVLKRRLEAAVQPSAEAGRPSFVELALGALPSAAPGCVLELADARGVRLRVELPEQAKAELGSVVRALWEAAR